MKEDEATKPIQNCSSVQLPWQSKSTSCLNDFCKDYCFFRKGLQSTILREYYVNGRLEFQGILTMIPIQSMGQTVYLQY